jgi:cysteine protease ATG4
MAARPPLRGGGEDRPATGADDDDDDDDDARLPPATRLRHFFAGVASRPSVRRARELVDPRAKVPASTTHATLLGRRYERGGSARARDAAAGSGSRGGGGSGGGGGLVRGEDGARGGDDDDAPRSQRADDDDGPWTIAQARAGAAVAAATAALRRLRSGDADDARDASGDDASDPAVVDAMAVHSCADDPGLEAFLADFRSLVWVTYRRGFPRIGASAYTTDAGWGCTLRSAQMLLANALHVHFFGREWRRRDDGRFGDRGASGASDAAAHGRLLSWFNDHPSEPDCPFSVHAILRAGGFAPGRWLGPCALAICLRRMLRETRPGGATSYVVAGEDGASFGGGAPVLRRRDVARHAEEEATRGWGRGGGGGGGGEDGGDGDGPGRLDLPSAPMRLACDAGSGSEAPAWTPTIVLVPLVLGLDRFVNPAYVPSLMRVLSIPQSMGFIGGRPGASRYVVGAQDDVLFFLDPHVTQPAVGLTTLRDGSVIPSPGMDAPELFPTASFHRDRPLWMRATDLDPSVVLGFYCRARADLDQLCQELKLLAKRAGSAPLLTVDTESISCAGAGASATAGRGAADPDAAGTADDDPARGPRSTEVERIDDWEML